MTFPKRNWVLAALALACGACAGGGTQQDAAPTLKAPDGKEYVLLAKGSYKPVYDAQGRLDRVEYDRNGDGKPDQIAHYDGTRIPAVVENDDDFDGKTDAWVYYSPAGVLTKIGSSRKGGTKPDYWVFPGPDGKPQRQEWDDDGDGKAERAEILKDGKIVGVETDTDRDGRIDRWQTWEKGRIVSEDLDTDGDGKPDRRLRYGPKGEVVGIEPLSGK